MIVYSFVYSNNFNFMLVVEKGKDILKLVYDDKVNDLKGVVIYILKGMFCEEKFGEQILEGGLESEFVQKVVGN